MKEKKIFGAVACILVILLAAIPTNAGNDVGSAKEAAEYAEQTLLLQEGVAGVDYTEDPARVTIFIESEEHRDSIPEKIKGVETEVIVTGRFMAYGLQRTPQQSIAPLMGKSRTSRWEELVGGISIGNEKSSGAGTLAVVFHNWWPQAYDYMLSCTHVLALDDYGRHLPKGTDIIQPGKYDGGKDVVGYLYKISKLRFGWKSIIFPNYIDASIAKVTSDCHCQAVLDSNNKDTYLVSLGIHAPWRGETVRKSGRTTGVTQNVVERTHATVIIWYQFANGLKYARFKDQIMVKQPFSDSGDSGSFVDKDGYFVGLVHAGSFTHSIVCKAWRIELILGL